MPTGVYDRATAKPRPRHSAETKAKIGAANRGKRRTEAERAEMSARRKGRAVSDEQRAKISAALAGRPGRAHSAEARAKMSAQRKGRRLSEEHKARIKAAVPTGAASPRFGVTPKRNRWVWYAGVHMRSSWEARFAAALDRRGIAWQYEPKTFDLGSTTYTPDFATEDGVHWEVKGWLNEHAQQKIAAFRRAYPEIPLVVVTRPVLQLLEH